MSLKKKREKKIYKPGCCRSCKEFTEIYHSMWYWMAMKWESFQQITYVFIIETQICSFIIHGPRTSTKDENEA